MKSGYLPELDYLRGIAILLVISIHVSANFIYMSTADFLSLFYMSIDTYSSVAVPLFIAISGFILFYLYHGGLNIKTFYRKRFFSVVPPYLFFTVFYLGFEYAVRFHKGLSLEINANELFLTLVTGGNTHLWFVFLIIQFYIIFPWLLSVFKRLSLRDSRYPLAFALTFQLVWSGFLSSYLRFGSEGFAWSKLFLFLNYLVYFVMGMYIASNHRQITDGIVKSYSYLKITPLLLLLTVAGIFSTAEARFGDLQVSVFRTFGALFPILQPVYFLLIILSLVPFVIVLGKNKAWFQPGLQKIGAYSFGIYLIHIFFLQIVIFLLGKIDIDWNWPLFYPVVFILTLVLSYSSVHGISQYPAGRFIIGNTRKNT